jgi:hypothetical protein
MRPRPDLNKDIIMKWLGLVGLLLKKREKEIFANEKLEYI